VILWTDVTAIGTGIDASNANTTGEITALRPGIFQVSMQLISTTPLTVTSFNLYVGTIGGAWGLVNSFLPVSTGSDIMYSGTFSTPVDSFIGQSIVITISGGPLTLAGAYPTIIYVTLL
jgi:hypothetical protein